MNPQSQERQKSPNRKLSGPTRALLASAAGIVGLVAANSVLGGNGDSSPKNNAPTATADAFPTQETGTPPVPPTPEVSVESVNQRVQAGVESLTATVIDQALHANNDTISSESYVTEDGLTRLLVTTDGGESGTYYMEVLAKPDEANKLGIDTKGVTSLRFWSSVTHEVEGNDAQGIGVASGGEAVQSIGFILDGAGNWAIDTSQTNADGTVVQNTYEIGNPNAPTGLEVAEGLLSQAATFANTAQAQIPISQVNG